MPETKTCTGCHRDLPLDAFGRMTSSPDGLAYRCKECTNAQKREYNQAKRQNASQMHKVFSNPELARFTPRQLIDELKARGYHGELKIIQTIKV